MGQGELETGREKNSDKKNGRLEEQRMQTERETIRQRRAIRVKRQRNWRGTPQRFWGVHQEIRSRETQVEMKSKKRLKQGQIPQREIARIRVPLQDAKEKSETTHKKGGGALPFPSK